MGQNARRRPTRETAGRGEAAGTRPWYADGLRFACTACGDCCRNHGDGFAFVYSTRAERRAIARHLGLTLQQFERRWCRRDDSWLVFKDRGDACVFLDERGRCSIYEHRPRQCRTFPFWPELLADRATWENDVASFCPGAGTGPLHTRRAIDEACRRSGT